MSTRVKELSPAAHFIHLWLFPSFPTAGVFLLSVSICFVLAPITAALELLSPAMATDTGCSLISHLPTVRREAGIQEKGVINRRPVKCCEEGVGVSQGFKTRRIRKNVTPMSSEQLFQAQDSFRSAWLSTS